MRIIITKAIALLITFSAAAFAQEKGTFTDSRDGKEYNTVKIGNLTWMAENLNYAVGDGEKDGKCYGESKNGESEVYEKGLNVVPLFSPAEIQAKCKKYGRLYSWETAKKVCPSGWHLPNDKEVINLISSIGGGNIVHGSIFTYQEENYMGLASLKLMAKGEWTKRDGGKPATCEGLGFACSGDDFGFAALPGGACCAEGRYPTSYRVGFQGYWWTATADAEPKQAYSFTMATEQPFGVMIAETSSLHSVRCVKN